jgi:hypothetical protein
MQPRIISWGFQVDSETLHFLRNQIEEFLDFCPDDSTADIKLAKTPTHYEMVARIYYDGGSYIAKSHSMLLTEAIHEVLDQLYDQVHSWRRIRNGQLGVEETPPAYD